MYSVVLMAALATSTTAPDFCHGCRGGWGCHGCHGGWGCHGCYGGYGGCYGCSGCWGGCYGCYGGYGYGGYGGYGGTYGWGCYGCWGGSTGWACYGFAYSGSGGGWGCNGCYGCYGGYSGYGVPVPAGAVTAPAAAPARTPEVTPAPIERRIPPVNEQTRAKVRIDVPADAKVYIDGQLMRTMSARRNFQTPPLDVGKVYFYDVKVEVERNGQTLTDSQRLIVRAGQQVSADFASLDSREPPTRTARSTEE